MPDFETEASRNYGGKGITISVLVKRDSDGACVAEQVWVVSQTDNKLRYRLPVPLLYKSNPMPFGVFTISPSDDAIIAVRKIGSGIDEAFVFLRTGKWHYRLADRISVNDSIGHKFGRPHDIPSGGAGNGPEFILFQSWERDGMSAVLACLYGPRNSSTPYLVTMDTRTGNFSNYRRVSENQVKVLP